MNRTLLFRSHLKWTSSVKRFLYETQATGAPPKRKKDKIKLLIIALLSIVSPQVNFNKSSNVFIRVKNRQTEEIANNYSSIYIGGDREVGFYQIISALDMLIIDKNFMPRRLRKLALFLLLNWIDDKKTKLIEKNFYVYQDFFNGESFLVSYLGVVNSFSVGYQHGLMRSSIFNNSNIFPCIRCKIQVVYNNAYREKFSKKNPDAFYLVHGFPVECLGENNIKRYPVKKIVWVSNRDIEINDFLINGLADACNEAGIIFLIRLHPSECKSTFFNRGFEIQEKNCVDEETLYVGEFSTFLPGKYYSGVLAVVISDQLTDEEVSFFAEGSESVPITDFSSLIEAIKENNFGDFIALERSYDAGKKSEELLKTIRRLKNK
ncbi:hypothetical protein OR573_04870 [Halomonas sp. CH40]